MNPTPTKKAGEAIFSHLLRDYRVELRRLWADQRVIYPLIRLIIFFPMPGTESRSSIVANHPLLLLNMMIRAALFGPMSGSVSRAFREARLMFTLAVFMGRVPTEKFGYVQYRAKCKSVTEWGQSFLGL